MLRAMCDICQGASDDELLFGIYGRIRNFGWGIEYVQGPDVSDSWGYTIGLSETFGHPELALAGSNARTTASLINTIGSAIRLGDLPVAGELFDCEGHEYLLVDVHPAHYELGTFGMWDFYYNHLGETPGEHRVLEVVPRGRSSRFTAAPTRHDRE